MKIFLINPDYLIYPFPPLGLVYIAGYLKKNYPDIDIRILDQLSKKEIIKKIMKEEPNLIGFSSTSPHHWKVRKLAEEIKESCPFITIVLGGIHVTNCPKTILNSPFDLGVVGEGEIPFKKLVENIMENEYIDYESLGKIPGFVFQINKELVHTGLSERLENLDETPIPPRDMLNMTYYLLPSFSNKETFAPTGLMFTSRGCPYNCSFCSSVIFWKRKVTFNSAKRVVDEMEELYRKYHYTIIQIYDDLFTINKTRLKEIVSLLKERKLLGKIDLRCFGRGNCFDEETAIILKELNVTRIDFGIETGSERLLPFLKNNISLKDNINAIKLCRKYGIKPIGAFMMGMPHETKEDLEATYNFIKEYISDGFVVSQMSPLPNTEVWNYAINNKLINEDIFETEDKRFLEFNKKHSLSLDVSPDILEEYWYKVAALNKGNIPSWKKAYLIFTKDNYFGFKKLFTLRFRHIILMFHPIFWKKVYNLTIKGERQG